MTKEQLNSWLHELVEHAYDMREMYLNPIDGVALVSYFSRGVDDTFSIQIYSGVRYIAKTLELELHEHSCSTEDDVIVWVEFEGCQIFQLESKYDSI